MNIKYSRGVQDCYLTNETELAVSLGLMYIIGVKKRIALN